LELTSLNNKCPKKKKILKWTQNYIQNIANKQLMALPTLSLMAKFKPATTIKIGNLP
jgi:hypothetical protein